MDNLNGLKFQFWAFENERTNKGRVRKRVSSWVKGSWAEGTIFEKLLIFKKLPRWVIWNIYHYFGTHRDGPWPDPTSAYFWPTVNKRPIRLWPGYFLTRPDPRHKNWPNLGQKFWLGPITTPIPGHEGTSSCKG